MEKITAALEKARAQRAEILGAESLGADPDGMGRPSSDASVSGAAPPRASTLADNWAALPDLRPDEARLSRQHIVTFAGGPASATFDIMRTKLLQQARAHGWRRIGVTSPTAGCGKTTVVLNLAFGLARQAEERVLVLDADLRRPSMASVLGHRPSSGLAEMLEGQGSRTAGLVRYGANLAFLSNPGPRRNPAELFQSAVAASSLAELDALLSPTIVLVDLPPLLTGDDVMAFAGHLDAVLLIAAAGMTTVREVDLCERELATRTSVMGVVVNRCRYLGQDYGYATYG